MVRRLLILLGLAAVCACSGPAALDRLSAGETGRVVEVRSGHLVVMDSGLEVRLAGVEAPTLSQPHGREARDALTKLALNQEVELLYGGARRDRYDRALAHLRLVSGRAWVQQELLKAGAVRVRTWGDNRAMAPEMLEAEARARRKATGLWALDVYRVRVPGERGGAYGFQIVEGRVARVTPSGARTYLDFSQGGLSAQIAASELATFSDAGKSPDALKGKLVRVRGPVSGRSLRLDHPEAVEVLKSR